MAGTSPELQLKSMDIGIIIPELGKYGGAERFLIECLGRWQHHHQITVYAAVFNEALFRESGLTRLKTKLLSPRFEGENATLLNATLLPKMWQAEIGRHDIYHAHLWPTHLIDLHPMVWYPHEPLRQLYDQRYSQISDETLDDAQRKLHFYPKQTYDTVDGRHHEAILRVVETFDATGRPDRVVANSRYSAGYLEQVYGHPVSDVVYPGVTVSDMPELPSERDVVLTIGQLWPHKRMRLIIESIAQVEGVQLHIVGSGPEQQRLENLAENMGVADRVFFLHDLENYEVQILLARCLCVVFAPVREPFGIVALEALAAGKPLIAVNEGGFVEVVDDRCALLVQPRPAALAAEIRKLFNDPQLASKMGRHGREIAKKYSWDRTADELIAIVEDTHKKWRARHRTPKHISGPLFAIHYFNWYREGFGNAHWCDDRATGWVTDMPELGYYSSMSGDTISLHIDQMESMGIDVVVFNLHVSDDGLDIYQLTAAQRMLSMAKERNSTLRFAVNLCLYTRDSHIIEQAGSLLRDSMITDENYLLLDGKPVFMIFWSGAFDSDADVVEQLKHLTTGFFRMGVYTRPTGTAGVERRKTHELFDAISQFSPLELSAPENWHAVWQKEYQGSSQASGHHCVTVSPGYDASHLTDPARTKASRPIPHNDGQTYRQTMKFALEQEAPSFVFISTFNEFHENSHIEPSQDHGARYMEMTRDFVAKARKTWKPASARTGDPEKKMRSAAGKTGQGHAK